MTTITAVPNTDDLGELVSSVWSSFLGEEITPADPGDATAAALIAEPTQNGVVASVSIIGPWTGQLFVAVDLTGAKEVASAMFAIDAAEVGEEEMIDALGELANVVGGNVKSMLPQPAKLSLPQVVVEAHLLSVPSATLVTVSAMAWGPRLIVTSLWEGPHEQADPT